MVQINFALKEVNCKIVYYGPGMSGKTTNLEVVHRKAPIANKGELTSIATEGDRTLFFDFMPLDLGNIAGMRTKFQLYTVPGQVYYNSTRKLVLQGVDGIIFVADSQEGKMEENLESIENLRNNLAEYGKNLDEIPMVLQYNKRDLPNVMDLEYLNEKLNPRGLPSYEGVATTGEGVFPTLKGLSAMVLESLSKEKRGAGAGRGRRPGGPPMAKTPAPTGGEAVAARTPAAEKPAERSAAATSGIRQEAFGPGNPAKPGRSNASPPQARRDDSGQAGLQEPPGVTETSSPRIRKGTDAYRMPPPEGATPSAEPTPRSDGSGTWPRSEPQAASPETSRDRSSESSPSLERPRNRDLNRGARPQRSPQVQRFVLEEERGSPILLIALGFIILVAAGVILYSFKII